MDYYQILGVNRNADENEIKQAYRKLAAQHHPDRGGNTAKFQEIQQAYDILSDPQKRAQFDNPGPQFGGFPGGGFPGFGGMEHPFADFFNQFVRPGRQQIFTVTVFVTLEQVARGEQEAIQINTGQGPTLVKLQIPPGIEDGQNIRYENIIPNAWLQVCFRIREHAKFKRTGLDLTSQETIDVFKLISGTRLEITDIYGKKLDVNVPKMTQPGTRLRIPNKGLHANGVQGDHYVLINGKLPDKIPEEILSHINKLY
jgi:DnaJ-class molecular chaperone